MNAIPALATADESKQHSHSVTNREGGLEWKIIGNGNGELSIDTTLSFLGSR